MVDTDGGALATPERITARFAEAFAEEPHELEGELAQCAAAHEVLREALSVEDS
ncbi:hypothetical protein CAQUA_06060 [Corynebacterium aquatimens]|uniref:Uncharacterized protein n=1 Tax=Corynebacterium aquatimens TaxID=1190508 RepID=A0A931E1B8_9CORY|nr:hypothetical protein [Corynebacterium aquatimens]WJY65918.1 hypothetical protein CAQUA_06060 [Corynebacterium aquatimens]